MAIKHPAGGTMRLQDCAMRETLNETSSTIVRRVRHMTTDDSFIVKMSVPGVAHQRVVARLIHEHHLLVKLERVPGIVRPRGFEHEGTRAVLWLEDAGPESFDRVLARRGRLPVEVVLRLGLGLSHVLDLIHTAGVVHKDIKPQNIIWDEATESVTLLDFAIASELAEEALHAAVPEALEGTLAYISPEQTGRTARGIDSRTDIYSFGVTLFEAFAGRRPFLETDPLALVHAHLAKSAPPLDDLVPGIPAIVVQIVERCLEKHPERRYQSAKGLAFDLETCVRSFAERGTFDSFVLGQKDYSPSLRIPQTLVARDEEVANIRDAFDRAAKGALEVLLLGGPSGVGKTALVRSVYQEMAKVGRGFLLSGKHDQLARSVPYAALAQAFGGFIRDIVASPKYVFDTWKNRIEQAIGIRARVIADLVPELEWLMGPLPPVPVVPTDMTYNRLKLSWIDFVRVVADASPPLVLFLDDLQWLDAASLELLKTLLTDVGKKNMLVIAAYRDNEVSAEHPLWSLVEALEKDAVKPRSLTVGPLDENAVETWLGAALVTEKSRVHSFSKALHAKTHGNPFFLGQLLLELHRQKRVRRNVETGAWEWDQNAVEQAVITDNVVELMRRKVIDLPANTQRILGQAACAGHVFSLVDLTILSGLERAHVVDDVRPALLAGLVMPQDGHYRDAQALAHAGATPDTDATYRFLHDRVQQAFYERIDVDDRTRTHLLIGRRLQAVFDDAGGSNQKLVEFVRHLNMGAAALTTEAERKGLARLNLQASKAAKVNGSYELQASLIDSAVALVGDRLWHDEPALGVELALERIEADFMLRAFDEVHRRAEELLTLPLPALPRLAAQELQVRTYLASGKFAEGERIGIAALEEQGIVYPATNEECIAKALDLLALCNAWFEQNPLGFRAMPADPSLEQLLCDAVEAALTLCAAIGSRPVLAALAVARNVEQITKRGCLTVIGAFFLGALANVRSALLGEYRSDARWAQEGEIAASRLGSPLFPECSAMRGYFSNYEMRPAQTLPYYAAARRAAAASGSFQGMSWALLTETWFYDFWSGRPLGLLAQKEQALRGLMTRAGDVFGQHVFAVLAAVAKFLCTSRPDLPPPGEEWFSPNSRVYAPIDGNTAEMSRTAEAFCYLAFGEHARALERIEEAILFQPLLYGNPPVTDIPLIRALAAAKCFSPSGTADERASLLETIDASIRRFQYFSEGCAANFLHKQRLLEAERARIDANPLEAMIKYDEAIDLARKEGFLHIEALAAQTCAEFYLTIGCRRNAATYLREARTAYLQWDALALVTHLDEKYPDLLETQSKVALSSSTPTFTTSTTSDHNSLDVYTAIRAAQALSGELDPERVVGRLMALCLANAGAERGALVFVDQETLVLVARLSVSDERIETGLSIPLGQCTDIATAAIQYVARSREPVVIDDVSLEKRFSEDAYLAATTVRSLLALPLSHRGRLGGVLYLEHRRARSAFPPSRVELLSVIAAQAAIAVENAHQMQALEARNREIQQLNDELRRQIAQRSRRLMETLLLSDGISEVGALVEGSLLGDCYRVGRMLGEGAMGTVYEVERTTDGMQLAAKILNHSPDRNNLGRFAREAEILAKLSHPNLISIHDIDVTDGGVLYIVMDLVAGSTLRTCVERIGDVDWVLDMLAQVAEALDALHTQGIVHRDLKPENILVVSSGSSGRSTIKLADFGISVITSDRRANTLVDSLQSTTPAVTPAQESTTPGRALTQTGVIVGTPLYMAPELGDGSKNAQSSSDVFAFGVIAFEWLTGSRPFSLPPVLGGVIHDDIATTMQQCPHLPSQVALFVTRCLAANPGNRPPANEFVEILTRAS